jgi:hypothetical protein
MLPCGKATGRRPRCAPQYLTKEIGEIATLAVVMMRKGQKSYWAMFHSDVTFARRPGHPAKIGAMGPNVGVN